MKIIFHDMDAILRNQISKLTQELEQGEHSVSAEWKHERFIYSLEISYRLQVDGYSENDYMNGTGAFVLRSKDIDILSIDFCRYDDDVEQLEVSEDEIRDIFLNSII